MESSAVITGVGPVSAIGCGKDEFWRSLLAGRHGIGPISLCDTSRSACKIGAEVQDFDLARFVDRGGAIARRSPRAVQLAVAASALALEDAGIEPEVIEAERAGVCAGTSLGNLKEGLDHLPGRLDPGNGGAPEKGFRLFNHSAACLLSALFDLRGPIHTTTTGCNSGLDALGQALRWVQLDLADVVLVVGTDCELIPEVLAMLEASGSLATRYNDNPGIASRPFDVDRDGNVIGEGAAALVLESEFHALERGARAYARLVGYSICAAGKNRKYSTSSPEIDISPSVRSLRGAISEAGWQAEEVELVNSNGSSSVIYDALEAQALAQVFGHGFPSVRVHSIKSMLGQHGAGSSALQAVAACLSIHDGRVPPTINHEKPDPECGSIRVVTEAEAYPPSRVLVHSIGFGGFYYSCGAFEAPS